MTRKPDPPDLRPLRAAYTQACAAVLAAYVPGAPATPELEAARLTAAEAWKLMKGSQR